MNQPVSRSAKERDKPLYCLFGLSFAVESSKQAVFEAALYVVVAVSTHVPDCLTERGVVVFSLNLFGFAVDGIWNLDALRHAPVVVSRFVSRFAELIKLSY